MAEFLRRHVYNQVGSPFDVEQVPWVTAPNGPCEAIDDPNINEIWLQWAARCFKTTLAQAMCTRQAAYRPCTMMYAARDQKTLMQKVFPRWWDILDQTPMFAGELPSKRLRSNERIDFPLCRVLGVWAGSASGLADEAIQVGHGGEVDKWVYTKTATEGDPLPRFLKRGSEFADRKFIIESTPSEEGLSRIEEGRLQGTNCKYNVPCPHCWRFQEILFGDGTEPGGIFWEKDANGRTDLSIARATAHYVCRYCEGRITDDHRFRMSNLGVWVPEGCEVDDDKALDAAERTRNGETFLRDWLIGTPARQDNIYSSQLSVFHAPFHGFGDIVVSYLKKHRREPLLQQWTNEDAGLTYRRKTSQKKWEELFERIHWPDSIRGVVPIWGSLLTCAIDRQEDFWVWQVMAWGPGRRHHVVTYGESNDLYWIRNNVLTRRFEHADGGEKLKVGISVVDNSFRPDSAVEEFCADCQANWSLRIWTVEGSETRLQSDWEFSTKGPRTSQPGLIYLRVDTHRTQEWVESVLHKRKLHDPGSGSIHGVDVPEEHQGLCTELLNERLDTSHVNKTGHARAVWQKVNSDVPNDQRDLWRYNYVAMLAHQSGRPIKTRGYVAGTEVSGTTVLSGTSGRENTW